MDSNVTGPGFTCAACKQDKDYPAWMVCEGCLSQLKDAEEVIGLGELLEIAADIDGCLDGGPCVFTGKCSRKLKKACMELDKQRRTYRSKYGGEK